MAQKKTTSSNRSGSRSKASSGTTSSRRAPSKNNSTRRTLPPPPVEKDPIWVEIWSYSWGKALYLLLGILVLIGLDLLIAMNKYKLFFTVLGVEIIAAMVIGWLVFLILERRKNYLDEADTSFSDEE